MRTPAGVLSEGVKDLGCGEGVQALRSCHVLPTTGQEMCILMQAEPHLGARCTVAKCVRQKLVATANRRWKMVLTGC